MTPLLVVHKTKRRVFLSAFARPLLRINSIAASISPLVSTRVFLHSIKPEPVLSRSSFTSDAEISIVITSCTVFLFRHLQMRRLHRHYPWRHPLYQALPWLAVLSSPLVHLQ